MKSSTPDWTICVPTVVTRGELFQRLVDRLAPQVEKANGRVEVLVFYNNFERQLGIVRKMLVDDAKGTYVSFIDDDDLVVEDYVETILPLLDGVDYIGFNVEFWSNGTRVNLPVTHSIKNTGWHEDGNGFYRQGVHTNPVRTELARKYGGYEGSDYRIGIPEDILYHDNISPHLKTEHYINRDMHIYLQTSSHAWGQSQPVDGDWERPTLPKFFRFHKESTKV